MTADVRLRGMMALLLAGTLVVHAFMLGHEMLGISASVAAEHDVHGRHDGGHPAQGSDPQIAAVCFSVLVGAAASAAVLLVRPESGIVASVAVSDGVEVGRDRAAPGAGGRDGPLRAVPVGSGVLLRV